jgi:hypothetical protein
MIGEGWVSKVESLLNRLGTDVLTDGELVRGGEAEEDKSRELATGIGGDAVEHEATNDEAEAIAVPTPCTSKGADGFTGLGCGGIRAALSSLEARTGMVEKHKVIS